MLSACTVHLQYVQVAIEVLIEACSCSGHIHIFTGASVQFLLQVCLCTLFVGVQLHLVQCVTGMYRCQVATAWRCSALAWFLVVRCRTIWFAACLGLVSCGPVQNNPVCCCHFDTGYANMRQPHILKS
jgi:hypothetical protein